MEQAQLEAIRQQFDLQVRSKFPEEAIERVEVLQYGDDPEVEPGQLLAQVVFHTPGGREQREHAFKDLYDERHAAFKELRDELDKLPVDVVLRFTAGGERAENEPKGPFIQLLGQRPGGPGGDDRGQTPVMARLGADDLETLDTLITAELETLDTLIVAGIANSRRSRN